MLKIWFYIGLFLVVPATFIVGVSVGIEWHPLRPAAPDWLCIGGLAFEQHGNAVYQLLGRTPSGDIAVRCVDRALAETWQKNPEQIPWTH